MSNGRRNVGKPLDKFRKYQIVFFFIKDDNSWRNYVSVKRIENNIFGKIWQKIRQLRLNWNEELWTDFRDNKNEMPGKKLRKFTIFKIYFCQFMNWEVIFEL